MADNQLTIQDQMVNATQTLVLAETSSAVWLKTAQCNISNVAWLHNQCKEIRCVNDAIKSNALTLGRMARELGEKKAQAFIKIELLKLNQRLDLNHPMTEFDISFIAEELTSGENRGLNIADISLIIDNICRGSYGEFYERISSQKFLTIVRKYMDERMDTAEGMSINDYNVANSDNKFAIHGGSVTKEEHEQMMALYEKKKQWRKEKAEQEEKARQERRERDERMRMSREEQQRILDSLEQIEAQINI